MESQWLTSVNAEDGEKEPHQLPFLNCPGKDKEFQPQSQTEGLRVTGDLAGAQTIPEESIPPLDWCSHSM